MALMDCPECKNMVSDKAEKCIHCGAPVEQTEELQPPFVKSVIRSMDNNKCIHCDTFIAPDTQICPNCGSTYPHGHSLGLFLFIIFIIGIFFMWITNPYL